MQDIRRSLGAGALVLTILVAACSGGASGSASPAAPSASQVNAPSGAPSVSPEPSTSPDPGGSTGGVPPSQPGVGQARIVTPKPGQVDVHPIAADTLSAAVDGRKVIVEIDYTTGVEPCYVLDSIVVQKGDHSFALTLRQGHEPGDAVCIQIAEMVRTFVDLGELAPGTYTITDTQQGAAPISVTVS